MTVNSTGQKVLHYGDHQTWIEGDYIYWADEPRVIRQDEFFANWEVV